MDHLSHQAPIELRPYQVEALEKIIAELARIRATLLMLATGLGKTVTFAALARHYVERGGKVLVLAHRAELLEQAAEKLRAFGLRVEIEQADQRIDPNNLPDVVCASVQTLQRKRLARLHLDTFTLVIVDESHHVVAKSYRAILDHFASSKVLGVTATADRTDRVGLHNVIESVAYRMEIAAGIKGGWLVPIELRSVVVEGLDLSRVRVIAGELQAAELETELVRDEVLHQIAGPLAELAAGRQTLVFTVGVEQAHALARVLGGYSVRAAAIDGSMPGDERKRVIADYRAGRVQALTNCMVLTEGFDAPETACIALARPTSSRSLITQMIGRGTRLAEGKRNCLVLDFVPRRAAKIRLAGPADVLAGKDLPDELAATVREMSGSESVELAELIQRAQARLDAREQAAQGHEQAERERVKQLVRQVGVVYAAARVDVETLLAAADDGYAEFPRGAGPWRGKPASPGQCAALEKAGYELPAELSAHDAAKLFGLLSARREKGLCTLKQARLLRKYGLRDDVSMRDAIMAIDAIAANRWRVPDRIRMDPRFARVAEVEACPA